MPDPHLVAADLVPPQRLHRAFTEAFADYVAGPFVLPLERWPQFLARQGVDLGLSRAVLDRGEPQAFALVAPRPARSRWRLATMGALPRARGIGAAAALLADLAARARQQGAAALELEVFAQNERALRLYRRHGFEAVHPLHGYETVAPDPARGSAPAGPEVGIAQAFAWLDDAARQLDEMPFQVTPASLRALAGGLGAWQQGSAQLVFGRAADGSLNLHSLVDRELAQRDAAHLVRGLLDRHPGCRVVVPALQRPDLGGDALRAAGFALAPLHQWLMLRRL